MYLTNMGRFSSSCLDVRCLSEISISTGSVTPFGDAIVR